MSQRTLHIVIKMSVAFIIAYFLASLFSLTYDITAGILAVLSIQLTKKDTVRLAVNRFLSAFIALGLASIFFIIIGYHIYVLLIFVPLFIFVSFILKLSMGIVPSLVLVNHIFQKGEFTLHFLLETMLLLFIATLTAFLINLIYPHKSKSNIQKLTQDMDQMLSDHLLILSFLLKNLEEPSDFLAHYHLLKPKVMNLIEQAKLEDKDILFQENRKDMAYLFMREAQFHTVYRMYDLAITIQTYHPNIDRLSSYIRELSPKIGKFNQAISQKNKLDEMMVSIKTQPLPITRSEFETRAILFQMIQELEVFLSLKSEYHSKYLD